MNTLHAITVWATTPGGGSGVINDAAIQRLLLAAVTIVLIFIGLMMLLKASKGDPKKVANVGLGVLIGVTVIALGVSAAAPQVGANILSTLLGV